MNNDQITKELLEARLKIDQLQALVLTLWGAIATNNTKPITMATYEQINKTGFEIAAQRLEKDFPELNVIFFPPKKS